MCTGAVGSPGVCCSALKVSSILLTAWYFWINCRLLIYPLMLREAKQSINDSTEAPSEPWKAKCSCMPWPAGSSSFCDLYNRQKCLRNCDETFSHGYFWYPHYTLASVHKRGQILMISDNWNNKPMGATVNLQVWLLTGWAVCLIDQDPDQDWWLFVRWRSVVMKTTFYFTTHLSYKQGYYAFFHFHFVNNICTGHGHFYFYFDIIFQLLFL